jgi:hypothetical protein
MSNLIYILIASTLISSGSAYGEVINLNGILNTGKNTYQLNVGVVLPNQVAAQEIVPFKSCLTDVDGYTNCFCYTRISFPGGMIQLTLTNASTGKSYSSKINVSLDNGFSNETSRGSICYAHDYPQYRAKIIFNGQRQPGDPVDLARVPVFKLNIDGETLILGLEPYKSYEKEDPNWMGMSDVVKSNGTYVMQRLEVEPLHNNPNIYWVISEDRMRKGYVVLK